MEPRRVDSSKNNPLCNGIRFCHFWRWIPTYIGALFSSEKQTPKKRVQIFAIKIRWQIMILYFVYIAWSKKGTRPFWNLVFVLDFLPHNSINFFFIF